MLATVLLVQLGAATAAAVAMEHGDEHACTISGSGAGKPAAAALREACEAAVPWVTGVWGSDWDQRVTLVLPDTADELSQLLPGSGHLGEVAALADADRVYVNPDALTRLSSSGLQVVLRHEVTHLAGQAQDPDMPIWLAEGLAEYVAFKGTDKPAAEVARELAAEVRAGKVSPALPTGRQFDGPRLPAVYQECWRAVTVLSRERGEAGVLRVYRRVLNGSTVDAALATEGLSTAGLTRLWRADLRRLPG